MDEYLGDGVYARSDDWGGIWLLANDHLNPTDKIYLEPSVFKALNSFNERINQDADNRKNIEQVEG